MDAVVTFLWQMREPGRCDQTYLFVRLPADAGKFHQIAASPDDLSKPGNFRARRVGVRICRQLGREKKPRDPHRLVDEKLFLVLLGLAPLQNVFETDDRRLKDQSGLEEQGEFHR